MMNFTVTLKRSEHHEDTREAKHPAIGQKFCRCGRPKRRAEVVCNTCRPAYAEHLRQLFAEHEKSPEHQECIRVEQEVRELLDEMHSHFRGITAGRLLFGIIQEFPQLSPEEPSMRNLFNMKAGMYGFSPCSRSQFRDYIEEYNFVSEHSFGETTEEFVADAFPIDQPYAELVFQRIDELGFNVHDEAGTAVDAEYILRPIRAIAIMARR